MARQWTEEQKQAASAKMKERNAAKKSAEAIDRTPIGAKRDITAVHDTPEGFRDRWVNDVDGRIATFGKAGYAHVETADVGSTHADNSHAKAGVVSKDMGKGVTAYLMRQREDFYLADQAEKQHIVDGTEESMRKKKVNSNESTDGTYGEVKIGQKA